MHMVFDAWIINHSEGLVLWWLRKAHNKKFQPMWNITEFVFFFACASLQYGWISIANAAWIWLYEPEFSEPIEKSSIFGIVPHGTVCEVFPCVVILWTARSSLGMEKGIKKKYFRMLYLSAWELINTFTACMDLLRVFSTIYFTYSIYLQRLWILYEGNRFIDPHVFFCGNCCYWLWFTIRSIQ